MLVLVAGLAVLDAGLADLADLEVKFVIKYYVIANLAMMKLAVLRLDQIYLFLSFSLELQIVAQISGLSSLILLGFAII